MTIIQTSDIHNILLVGATGAGKTTLVDAMLFESGATQRKGSVPEHTSASDYEKEEREHEHSIYTSVMHVDFEGKRINLVDTPGAPDFMAQPISCLPACETVFFVTTPGAPLDPVSRRIFELAKELELPRAVIVNKIDTAGENLMLALEAVRSAFGPECRPVNLPAKGGKGVVDCLLGSAGDSDLGDVKTHHTAILDQIVELDDKLMEKYLEGEEPNYEVLHAPFEKAMDTAHLVPVCFTDAKNGVGVKELMQFLVRYAPSPLEGNPRPFFTGEGAAEERYAYENDANKPLLAHIFKVRTDPFIGKLAFFRVYQGKLGPGSQVYIGASRRPIRIGHVFHLQGKDNKEAEAIAAGDIGAIAKIDELHIGDVLHEDAGLDTVHHKSMRYPTPLYGVALESKTRADDEKVVSALTRFADEDPTFKIKLDPETRELVVYGLGELHVRVMVERLKQRELEVTTKPPTIAFRETINGKADGHYRHKKQTGGAGQFAEVFLRVEPMARGTGFEFVNDIFGGAIPAQFVAAVEKGVKDAIDQGVIAGYPVQDVRVSVYDGKTHPVDSKEVAFRTAGKFAFRDAFMKAKPVVLEPIVNLEITAPASAVGGVTGDLASKRARILGTDVTPSGAAVVRAQAPLAELTRYQAQLRGITAGQGSFTMELSHYDPVSAQIQQQLVAAFKPKTEE